jgi:hypothetical protein
MVKNDYVIDFDDPRLINAIDDFDIIEFLEENDIPYSLEGKNIGDNFIGVSPCPNSACGDAKFHAGIHKTKKFVSCFKCKCYFSLPVYISMVRHINFEKSVNYLLDNSFEDVDFETQIKRIFQKRKKQRREYEPALSENLPKNRPITERDLEKNKYLANFFKEKHLRYYHVKRYDLRIGKSEIIFPIYQEGKVKTYQSRKLVYKSYHTGNLVPKFLVNGDNILKRKPLIIVEGFLDFISTNTVVEKKYKDKVSVATGLVKMLSAEQQKVIIRKNPSRIISMLDYDSWFEYSKMQKDFPFNVDYIILEKGQDPNSTPLVYLDYLIKKEIM